jgi:uncharacterized spore protein YtfJ
METKGKLQKIIDPITDHAHVETVFGQPQVLKNKIVVPVARVFLMIGGGMGSGVADNDENQPVEGGGGGFVLSAHPIGVLEITEETTRLVKFRPWWVKILPLSFGFLIGIFVLKLKGKNHHHQQ